MIKKRIPLLYLFIDYLSVRSVPHILSLKDEYTFGFSNILGIGSCNSSDYCWFGIILLLIAQPEDFLSNNL